MSDYTSEEVTEMAAECVDLRQTVEAWAAVIEAAEALKAVVDDAGFGFCTVEVHEVCETVRALQEARDE